MGSHGPERKLEGVHNAAKGGLMKYAVMIILMVIPSFAKASELVKLPREMEVSKYVEFNNMGNACEYPISMKQVEKGEDNLYFILETWCKNYIYRQTCHKDHERCYVTKRKRKWK